VWHDQALKLLHERLILVDLTFYRSFFTSTARHAARSSSRAEPPTSTVSQPPSCQEQRLSARHLP
jgi:hypothetical protein